MVMYIMRMQYPCVQPFHFEAQGLLA